LISVSWKLEFGLSSFLFFSSISLSTRPHTLIYPFRLSFHVVFGSGLAPSKIFSPSSSISNTFFPKHRLPFSLTESFYFSRVLAFVFQSSAPSLIPLGLKKPPFYWHNYFVSVPFFFCLFVVSENRPLIHPPTSSVPLFFLFSLYRVGVPWPLPPVSSSIVLCFTLL